MIVTVMDGWNGFGKSLSLIGAIVSGTGPLKIFVSRIHPIPWLGILPGDLVIEKKNITVYFPLTASIILSMPLTLLPALFIK